MRAIAFGLAMLLASAAASADESRVAASTGAPTLFHYRPERRVPPSLEPVLQHLRAGSDAFPEEKEAEELAARLDELGGLLRAGRAREAAAALLASDFRGVAGFAETLVRGLGDSDALSKPQGMQISAEAKEKFRVMLGYFAETGQSFQLDTNQDQSARQLLDVIEQVYAATPITRQRIVFAHLEDATVETLARIKKLGGGIAVQDRLALAAEWTVELWGEAKARQAPPLRTMLDSGIPVGAGTDAFRSANYSPMLSLWWLITGRTVAGSAIRPRDVPQWIAGSSPMRVRVV